MKMKKLYRKTSFGFIKFISLLISSLLGIFFGSSCFYTVEYGMPHANYKIKGVVKAAKTGSPISGILVSLRDTLREKMVTDSTFSDSLGRYIFEYSDFPEISRILRAVDIDGNENGEFIQKDTIISIPESELTGGEGGWYHGYCEKNVDIQMDESQQ
jgi:putative lipoprotein (rSAM/lipoprotein system)